MRDLATFPHPPQTDGLFCCGRRTITRIAPCSTSGAAIALEALEALEASSRKDAGDSRFNQFIVSD